MDKATQMMANTKVKMRPAKFNPRAPLPSRLACAKFPRWMALLLYYWKENSLA